MPQKPKADELRNSVQKVMKIHFGFVAAYALSVIIFDTWDLITHEGIRQRWTLVGVLFIVNTIAWYLARNKLNSQTYYRALVLAVVVADILFASINIFWERGMASRYVALFAVPLALSAVLKSRRAVIATAAFCMAAYVMTTTRYFYEHYGEGYKVELYGTAFFFSAVFFVVAALVSASFTPKD